MNCSICTQRYALALHVPDRTGLMRPMCIECAAEHARPSQFPEGTQRTARPSTDFADHEREAITRSTELHVAQRDALAHVLHRVLHLFRRELGAGYSTAEAQQALREARALLEECK